MVYDYMFGIIQIKKGDDGYGKKRIKETEHNDIPADCLAVSCMVYQYEHIRDLFLLHFRFDRVYDRYGKNL